MTDLNTNAPASNSLMTKKQYYSAVSKLGMEEANGKLKRPEYIVLTARLALEGVITADDAKDSWLSFRTKGENKIAGMVLMPKSSDDARASEIRQVIKAGAIEGADFHNTLATANRIIATSGLTGKHEDYLFKLARVQIKKYANAKMTDDEIRGELGINDSDATPKEAKDEATMLADVIKMLDKIEAGKDAKGDDEGRPAYPSEALSQARDLLKRRAAMLYGKSGKTMPAHVSFAKK